MYVTTRTQSFANTNDHNHDTFGFCRVHYLRTRHCGPHHSSDHSGAAMTLNHYHRLRSSVERLLVHVQQRAVNMRQHTHDVECMWLCVCLLAPASLQYTYVTWNRKSDKQKRYNQKEHEHAASMCNRTLGYNIYKQNKQAYRKNVSS